MKRRRINPFRIPRDPKELFIWIIKQMFMSLGCSGSLGLVALLIVSLSIFGFLVGDYTSGGSGAVTGSSVTLDNATTTQNTALKLTYDSQADAWQKGLSADQIAQVEQQQVNLPGAVLLGIGKLINNMSPTNAETYYNYLAPTYTWKTYTDVTIRYTTVTVNTKDGPVTHQISHESDTKVTMLVSADTWDGTLTDSYKWVETMQGTKANGVYTKKIELSSSSRAYDWSRVWNLFAHIPTAEGNTITNTKTNQDMLAGLIGSVDYTITDPYVQQMVSTILFPGEVAIGNLGPIEPPSKSTIQNVVRWKNYIDAAAKEFQIPPVLVAGVMYQESGGLETNPDGTLLTSSAGAVGLMQVEPDTAAGLTLNGTVIGQDAMVDLANPILNIEIGAEYLSEMYHQFAENPSEAESAYNAGPGAEQEAIAEGYQVAQNPQTIEYVQAIQGSWIPALTKYFGQEQVQGNNSKMA